MAATHIHSGRFSIQAPVLNHLSVMLFMNVCAAVEIGNGAGKRANGMNLDHLGEAMAVIRKNYQIG